MGVLGLPALDQPGQPLVGHGIIGLARHSGPRDNRSEGNQQAEAVGMHGVQHVPQSIDLGFEGPQKSRSIERVDPLRHVGPGGMQHAGDGSKTGLNPLNRLPHGIRVADIDCVIAERDAEIRKSLEIGGQFRVVVRAGPAHQRQPCTAGFGQRQRTGADAFAATGDQHDVLRPQGQRFVA